jgi:nucleoside-diphosphate-sugar epimerase
MHMESIMTQSPALILGITGGVGFFTARALARAGHPIIALTRDPGRAAAALAAKGADFPVTWHRGDALDAAAVLRAAEGVGLILHGVNPPKYRRWREDALPMLANSVAAARAMGARLLFPGNLYVFSEAAGALVDETTPQTPRTRKGLIRMEMEALLNAPDLRSLVLRAGDYFAPDYAQSWFGQMLLGAPPRVRAVLDLATPGVGHSWAYLPDLAEAFARLAAREAALPARAVFHFEGHWLADGASLAPVVQAALPGRPTIRRFPWWLMRLIAPVTPMVREALDMRWLWRHPLRLDNRALQAVIGPEPRTKLAEAVALSLAPATPHYARPVLANPGWDAAAAG